MDLIITVLKKAWLLYCYIYRLLYKTNHSWSYLCWKMLRNHQVNCTKTIPKCSKKMSFPKQLHCDMIFLKSLAKVELWFYGFWFFRNMVFRFGLRRSSRKGNLKHDIFCVISKDNVPFSCEYVITFWLKMKDDLPLKNTLKVDISCIIGSVDTLPKKFDVTLYIGKLKRFFLINDFALDRKLYQRKSFLSAVKP